MDNGASPSNAVAEMMRAEHEQRPFGVAGYMLPAPAPQIHTLQPAQWRPPPPDWEQERIEREQREREQQEQARARIVDEELAKITDDGEPPETRPAKPRRRWRT